MNPTVECLANNLGTLLESPRMHPESMEVSFVDIPTGRLFLWDPRTSVMQEYSTGIAPLGAALPTEGGGWLLCGQDRLAEWRQDHTDSASAGERRDPIMFGSDDRISNDAAIDPWGRLYVGRMSLDERHGHAELLAVETDGTQRVVADGLTIPNGLLWTPDQQEMLFVESVERRIYRMPSGVSGESWSERTVLVEYGEGEIPDGITYGPDGTLWVGCFGAGRIDRLTLDGERLGSIELPVSQVTAGVFVADDLYITTAAEGLSDADWQREPLAGSLFRVRNATEVAQ